MLCGFVWVACVWRELMPVLMFRCLFFFFNFSCFVKVGHTGAITCCSIFKNDTLVISGSDDRTIRIWKVCVRTL